MQEFRDKIPNGENIIKEDRTQDEMIRAQAKITGFSPNSPSSSEKIWGYESRNGGMGAMQMLGIGQESTRKPIENIMGSGAGHKTNMNEYLSMGKSKKMNVDGYFNMGKKSKGKSFDAGSYLSIDKNKTKFNKNKY